MLQIKTIYDTEPEKFDEKVNAALADGWTLVKRHLGTCGWNAELEKEIITKDEQDCDNCEYCDLSEDSGPCRTCQNFSNWTGPNA